MKTTEMNAHEKLAYRFVCEVTSEMIGGYENTLLDCDESDEEYKIAYDFLHLGHDELTGELYAEVMARSDKSTTRALRFAGESFIKERISRRLTKWGY